MGRTEEAAANVIAPLRTRRGVAAWRCGLQVAMFSILVSKRADAVCEDDFEVRAAVLCSAGARALSQCLCAANPLAPNGLCRFAFLCADAGAHCGL
jgi:hypothetical protein